jgi:hypothetical protein
MPLDRDQTRFKALDQMLFGTEGWQSKFARMCGISQQLVSKISTGDRKVTDTVKAAVVKGLRAEAKRLRERVGVVTKLLREYE